MARNTKETILTSAKRLFARHGYDGCNMDRIALDAQINKATIYYHFGSKSRLYETVLEVNLKRFLKRIRSAIHPLSSPDEKLKAFTRAYAGNFAEDRQMAPLMLRELASDGAHLTRKTRSVIGEIIGEVDAIIAAGQSTHMFKEVRSFIPYFLIVGSMNIFTSTPSMRKSFDDTENDFGLSCSVEETAAEISSILLNGIRK